VQVTSMFMLKYLHSNGLNSVTIVVVTFQATVGVII
jgi:hypothetical protein